jgi:hypothetical protein
MKISASYPLVALLAALAYATMLPFNFRQVNRAELAPDGGIVFKGYSTAYTTSPPSKLAQCDSMTIVLKLETAMRGRQGCILDFAASERSVNLRIEQWHSSLLFSMNNGPGPQRTYLELPGAMKPGVPITAVMFFDGHTMSGWRSGGTPQRSTFPPGAGRAWNPDAIVSLGSTVNGKFDWRGRLWSITVFDRVLTLEDLMGSSPGPGTPGALLSYVFTPGTSDTVRDQGRAPVADLIIPKKALGPRREMLESAIDYWRGPVYITDVFLNVIVFVPLGFLTYIVLRRRMMGFLIPFLLACTAMFLCSLSIEIAQHFLPTRNSSMMDVVSNSLGGVIGAILAGMAWPRRLLEAFKVVLF